MGGRGSASSGIAKSNRTRNEIFYSAENSRLKGLRNQAREREGKFAAMAEARATNAQTFSGKEFKDYSIAGNTIIYGTIGGKAVFYADKSNSPAIMKLMSEREARGKKFIEDMKKDMAITASKQGGRTSTYDRWEKRNRSKFDAWFNGS